jgi:uncharacterized membrane protein YqgA involved in biofilm formation
LKPIAPFAPQDCLCPAATPQKGINVLGTIVNALAIIAGSLAGLFLRGGLQSKYSQTVMQGMGLAVILIGLKSALAAENMLIVIFSLATGCVCGEWLKIEQRLESVGRFIESHLARSGDGFARGFVTTSLIFCVGSMAIVGALESGLTGNHQTLYAKSVLDGITSIVFASTLGLGVVFSAASVFLYQSCITLAASLLKVFLVEAVIAQMSAVGGLMIVAVGINILELKRIRVGNMLPAIFAPLLFHIIRQWL